MSAEVIKTIFDWAALILVALTVVAGVGALVTGNILSERQAAQLRQFDRDLTEAKTKLSEQQERAAKAESALLELQQKLADRTLTDAQLDEIIGSLKPFSGTKR